VFALLTGSYFVPSSRADADTVPEQPVNTQHSVGLDATPCLLAIALIADFASRHLVPNQRATLRKPMAKLMSAPKKLFIRRHQQVRGIKGFVVTVNALRPLAREASRMKVASGAVATPAAMICSPTLILDPEWSFRSWLTP